MVTFTRPHPPAGAESDTPTTGTGGLGTPWWTMVMVLAAIAGFGVLAFAHRWVSDDGLIVAREVRQILAGNGPNYNPFQRDEVDTSPLWTWLLVGYAGLVRGDVAVDTVSLGLLCTLGGLALGVAGCLRFHRMRGGTGLLLPVGLLVPLAVAAFWDFATSGLETGLSILWFGATWWLLLWAGAEPGGRRLLVASVGIGLGPLVRPDFTLATAVFGAALLYLGWPGWRRGLGYLAAMLALPVGYEIFRAGYYGITVPMPALAKEASSSLWGRGFQYLNDFVGTYQFWIPLAIGCVIATRMLGPTPAQRRVAATFAAPVLSAVLLGGYVVRVGGDYMSGRMWVPVVFVLLLPMLLVPVSLARRTELAGVALLAIWALLAGLLARTPYQGEEFGPNGMTNERSYEAAVFADPEPTTSSSRTFGNTLNIQLQPLTTPNIRELIMSSQPTANGPLYEMPLAPGIPDHSAFFYNNMGIAEVVMPLDGTIVDVNGLASPLAGHLRLDGRGRPGHEKWLPAAWVIAEYGDPADFTNLSASSGVSSADVLAARHALSCGQLRDLMDSVDQPMSLGRFWSNLVGAVTRTSLRIPADPMAAEREFCG